MKAPNVKDLLREHFNNRRYPRPGEAQIQSAGEHPLVFPPSGRLFWLTDLTVQIVPTDSKQEVVIQRYSEGNWESFLRVTALPHSGAVLSHTYSTPIRTDSGEGLEIPKLRAVATGKSVLINISWVGYQNFPMRAGRDSG